MIPQETTEELVQTIHEMAAKSFQRHILKDEGGTDILHSWSCRGPGTGIYAFRVISAPGLLIVHGDVGEGIWQVSDRDSVRWLRGAFKSRDYVLGKLVATKDPPREFKPQDALRYLDEMMFKEGRLSEEHYEDLRRAALTDWEDPGTAFAREWYEVGLDDPPRCQGPTSQALWLYECLCWFIQALPTPLKETP